MSMTSHNVRLFFGSGNTEVVCSSIHAPQVDIAEVKVTNLTDTAEQVIGGLRDFKELSFECHYEAATFDALTSQLGVSQGYKVTFPDLATYIGQGFLKSLEPSEAKSEQNEPLSIKGTIRCSGEWVYSV